ncbi:MAG: hypothetical protein KatS3mg009_2739 [Acidimicrobiia bacterium]|nr:MAG: hypothetical protein KatS3mg009_2739 [Acidimicrobiia bacterium]
MKRLTRRVRRARSAARLPHPRLKEAVLADLRFEYGARTGGRRIRTRAGLVRAFWRMVWESDAFGALVCYRIKASAQRAGIPVVPRIAHRIAMSWAQVSIGDPVLVRPGVRLPHGQVVIDGFVEIESGVAIRPFVTIGLKEGDLRGPTIRANARIGTGAKIIGPVTIGRAATVGANAVVLHDVAPGAVVAGAPARPVAGTDRATT